MLLLKPQILLSVSREFVRQEHNDGVCVCAGEGTDITR